MNKYTTTASNLKRKILRFSEKVSEGLKRPQFKLISQMVYGLLVAQNCNVTNIARALHEEIPLKKTTDRLSRNLGEFDQEEQAMENYLKIAKKHIKKDTPLLIDLSETVKPYGEKFEDLGLVRDGSTGKIEKGYWTCGAVALGEQKLPIPVYERIYSGEADDFESENRETFAALDFLDKHFGKSNIRAFDRGYDRNLIYGKLIKSEVDFIVRAKKNRDVYHQNKKINILKLANKRKGKYVLNCRRKNGVMVHCKVSILPIELPEFRGVALSLVVCHGFGKDPLMLITSLKSDDSRICTTVTKVYLLRWRIEEFYRLKKEQFGFEGFRVRSLKSIRNLDLMLTFALGLLAILGEKRKQSRLVMEIVAASQRLCGRVGSFCLYAIADGISACVSKCNSGFWECLRKPSKISQLSFFELNPRSIDWTVA